MLGAALFAPSILGGPSIAMKEEYLQPSIDGFLRRLFHGSSGPNFFMGLGPLEWAFANASIATVFIAS